MAVIDEKYFLTVFQPVLPLHQCPGPTTTDSTVAESIADPLQSVADSAVIGDTLTETS
jgi:hypothetical protein